MFDSGASKAAWLIASMSVLGALAPVAVRAGEADVIRVRSECDHESVCVFYVTVKHPDVGWKHYADRFEVLGPDGQVLATRVLQHPHVHEQPFTRSSDGVEIPPGIEVVTIRAHDSLHGDGGKQVEVSIARPDADPEAGPSED